MPTTKAAAQLPPLQEGETRMLPDGTYERLVTRQDGKKVIQKFRKKRIIKPDTEVIEGEIIVRPDGRRLRVVRKKTNKGIKEGEIIVRPDGRRVRVVRKKKTIESNPSAILQNQSIQERADLQGETNPPTTLEGQESAKTNACNKPSPAPEEPESSPSPKDITATPAPTDDSWVLVNRDATSTGQTPDVRVKLAVVDADGHKKKESTTGNMTLNELVGLLLEIKDSVVVHVLMQDGDTLGKIAPQFELLDVCAPTTDTANKGAHASPEQHPTPATTETIPVDMEMVPRDVAEAGRITKELGIIDVKSLVAGDTGALLKELKFANHRKERLEQQLIQAGLVPADDIPYDEAKEKIVKIGRRLLEIGGNDVEHPDPAEQTRLRQEYHTLTCEMERLDAALVLTEEYKREQEEQEEAWEQKHAAGNEEALRQIRRHMPLNCRNMTLEELTTTATPNGKFLPKAMARKFKRTSVLKLVRFHPNEIEKRHPAFFNSLRVIGMTLTERRAVHAQLQKVASKWRANRTEASSGLKWKWYQLLRDNLKVALEDYDQHCLQCGPPGNHECHLIGCQCPLEADKKTDYSGDYGFPDLEEYIATEITKPKEDPGAQALKEAVALAKEKAANEREEGLKKHYKSILALSQAKGSCAAMDEAMDKIKRREMEWVENMVERGVYSDDQKRKELIAFTKLLSELKRKVFALSERAGVETKGAIHKKEDPKMNGPDPRSVIECALCEELKECIDALCVFVEQRMKALQIKDPSASQTMGVVRSSMLALHKRNLATLERLGHPSGGRSRKLRSIEDMEKEVRARAQVALSVTDSEISDISDTDEEKISTRRMPPKSILSAIPTTHGDAGRGGLLASIRGGNKPSGKMSNGLLAAIAAG